MGIRDVQCEDVDWIQLVEDRDQQKDLVNMVMEVMDLHVP